MNGISGQVISISENSVKIWVNRDIHLNHDFQGREFEISKYTFLHRDAYNNVIAVRKQLPIKLGYAVTVDKSQGRTLDAVVVDSTNFWRPGQLGVAIGRATAKESVQLSAYNKEAACIQHPNVKDFYDQRSLLMQANLLCCNQSNINETNFLMTNNKKSASELSLDREYNPNDMLTDLEIQEFPLDIDDYVNSLIAKMPKITQIQMDQIQILQDAKMDDNFKKFLSKSYTVVSHLFNLYKVSPKKNKCNWCRMCAYMHMIFTSSAYKNDILNAFHLTKLKSNENSICTRIYFNILEIMAEKESTELKHLKLEKFLSEHDPEVNLDSLDKSSLQYIAGATIHSLRDRLENLCMKEIMNDQYRSKLNHRKHQLTSKLIRPPQNICQKSCEPESLSKLIKKDYGGLLYVTDDTFKFFKLLLITTRKLQNIRSLQLDPHSIFTITVNKLNQDVDLIACWFQLFSTPENLINDCECSDMEETVQLSSQDLLQLEMDETLIFDLFECVILYFCKVHCAEKVTQLKDYVLEKPKTFQLRHTLDENTKCVTQKIVQFPCGICGRECIDIIHKKKASFEDFSIQCDKCNKWFHYICVNLTGKEPQLQENSNIPYYCPECTQKSDSASNVAQDIQNVDLGSTSPDMSQNVSADEAKCVRGRGSGHGTGSGHGRGQGHGHGWGRGRGRGRGCGRGRGHAESTDSSINLQGNILKSESPNSMYISVSSRGRKRKAVNRDDYVT